MLIYCFLYKGQADLSTLWCRIIVPANFRSLTRKPRNRLLFLKLLSASSALPRFQIQDRTTEKNSDIKSQALILFYDRCNTKPTVQFLCHSTPVLPDCHCFDPKVFLACHCLYRMLHFLWLQNTPC